MKKLGVRAWEVSLFGVTSLVFADSPARAKMSVVRIANSIMGQSMENIFNNIKVKRAYEYDERKIWKNEAIKFETPYSETHIRGLANAKTR